MRTLIKAVLIASALSVPLTAGQALAIGLSTSGPVNSSAPNAPPPANGLPSWYLDSNGLALQGCLDNTPLGTLAPMCILPIIQEEDYDFHLPIVYSGGLPQNLPAGPLPGPTAGINGGIVNYPSETFYYYVSSNPKVPLLIGTGSISLVLMALEGAYVTKDGRFLQQSPPLPAGAKAIGNSRPVDQTQGVFQRFKILLDNAPVAGNYTFTHPWGSTVFNCPTAGALCKFVQDIPLGAPLNFLTTPDPALGQTTLGSIGPFMVSALPTAPATPAPLISNPAGHLFIGNPTAVGTKGVVPGTCATCNRDAQGFSFIRIDGPAGSGLTTGNVTEFFIGGQVLGLQVAPGANDLGLVKVGVPSPGKTFTVTNMTGAPATLTLTSSNPAFTIPAATDHCTTNAAAVPPVPPLPSPPPGNTCSFDVVFTPTVDGPASGTMAVTALGDPPATVAVTGTGDGIAPTLAITQISRFANTLTQTLSGTAADNNGISSVTVTVNAGAAQAATMANGVWTLVNPAGLNPNAANTIAVTASDIALPVPGNQTVLNDSITVDTVAPAVTMNPLASASTTVGTLTVSGTATDSNGISSLGINLNGTLQGLAAVTAGTWSFTVNNLTPNVANAITATASDPAANQSTTAPVSVTFVVPHDGDITMDGIVDISDSLMALRTAVGLGVATLEQKAHGDVFPLDAVTLKPLGDTKNDVADALLLLRKTVGLVTSF